MKVDKPVDTIKKDVLNEMKEKGTVFVVGFFGMTVVADLHQRERS